MTISVGIKLGNSTTKFRIVQANQVLDNIKATKKPLKKPLIKPCIYMEVTATGIDKNILSNLIHVASINDKLRPIILNLFWERESNHSANTKIVKAKDSVSVLPHQGKGYTTIFNGISFPHIDHIDPVAGGFGVLGDIANDGVTFGTVLKAANVLQNAGGLTQAGVGQELIGSAIGDIGKKAGIDVSGVAGVAFPTGGGGGGLSTIASAAAIVGGGSLLKNALASGASTSKTSTADANSFSGPEFPEE